MIEKWLNRYQLYQTKGHRETNKIYVEFTLESLTYWVFADFNWVLVKFIVSNISFLLYLLCNINYFNWLFN